ncbi:copG protein [Vibrio ishigakensis]|uniref:CopG protein n=1 Tax=Vibrio ishigakensis TaxID=1481914 RepID=A0A0B8PII1_9VIBR|nr:copG protein [Vibrio ishigakensis]
MKSVNKLVLSVSLLFTSLSYAAKFDVEMYKSPQCGCCTEWAEILEAKGYQVEIHEQNQWNDVKQKFGMPAKMTSCHTAIIDGYLIEGHVPEREIARLLKERPEGVKGLVAPGMPMHSPGMAREGEAYRDFDVIAFTDEGSFVYASY